MSLRNVLRYHFTASLSGDVEYDIADPASYSRDINARIGRLRSVLNPLMARRAELMSYGKKPKKRKSAPPPIAPKPKWRCFTSHTHSLRV